MKVCSRCKLEKDKAEFSKNKNSKDLLQSKCKVCMNEYGAYYRKHIGSKEVRAKYIKKSFNISIEEYNDMYVEQHAVCAICNKTEKLLNNKGQPLYLAVDHNHATGEVRGLLCSACNRGIGLLTDSPKVLKSALEYLETRGNYGKDN